MRISSIITALCLLLASFSSLAAHAHRGEQLNGIWESKGGTYFQIYRQNDHFVGKIVGSRKNKPIRDKSRASEEHAGPSMMGQIVLHGLEYQGDGKYTGGHIYNPKNGKTYKARARLKDHDTLEARAYIGISLIGKSETWHRVSPRHKHVQQHLLQQSALPQQTSDGAEKPGQR